jgi:hypothetical protein
VQQARNLLMDLEDAGMNVKFVLHDRDASFTSAFDAVSRATGARIVRSAIQAPCALKSSITSWRKKINMRRKSLPACTLLRKNSA